MLLITRRYASTVFSVLDKEIFEVFGFFLKTFAFEVLPRLFRVLTVEMYFGKFFAFVFHKFFPLFSCFTFDKVLASMALYTAFGEDSLPLVGGCIEIEREKERERCSYKQKFFYHRTAFVSLEQYYIIKVYNSLISRKYQKNFL